MHFTRITKITNSSTLLGESSFGASDPNRGSSFQNTFDQSGDLSAVVETVGSSASTLTPSVRGSFSINPIVEYQIQDSKEFYNGIHTQVNDELIAHYLYQGWPSKHLAMLLIEKITITDENGITKTFDNNLSLIHISEPTRPY